MAHDKLSKVSKLPKSKYKGVWASIIDGKYIRWIAAKTYKGKKYQKGFETEREAALAHDKMCLSFGLEPENILVKKIKAN